MNKDQVNHFFVGTWKGTDNGMYIPGEINNWVVVRKTDGTFKIKYTTYYQNGFVDEVEEQGTWEILENNIFKEFKSGESQPDLYFFNILTPNSIHYIDASGEDPIPYNFYDHRILLD